MSDTVTVYQINDVEKLTVFKLVEIMTDNATKTATIKPKGAPFRLEVIIVFDDEDKRT